MAKVIFSLTDRQAAALVALSRHQSLPLPPGRSRTLLLDALHRRGLMAGGHLTLLGQVAASLAIALATASHTEGGRDGA